MSVPELIASPQTTATPLDVRCDIAPVGVAAALTRPIRFETQSAELIGRAGLQPNWRPSWRKPKAIRLTFPEGFEFVPEKPERTEPKAEHQRPPKDRPKRDAPKKRTKIKPPSDALTLEDRLFFLLQPPIEQWLAGQELVMPFEPFPHQYEGIAWLFSQEAALLADEMGLGKTMQTITAIRLLLRAGHIRTATIICPKPLIPNWQREIAFWAEELPVTTIEGNSARRKLLWSQPGVPLRLANYESAVRDFQAMQADHVELGGPTPPKFDLLVLDEAQRIKNRSSRTAETIMSIKCNRSWALTGTPIENHPDEMASLYEFLQVIPKGQSPDLRRLAALSDRYVLRRTKDLAMKDMPPRFDRDALLELSPAQDAAYKMAEQDGIMRLDKMGEEISIQHVFELVLRLKQICNYDPVTGQSAKLDRLAADLEEIHASGGKAILFSQWTRSLDWIAEGLRKIDPKFNPLIYHGGVPTKQREPILDRFKNDPDCPIILMSYGTGAVGLNLQFAGYVFLYDRWWNPAVEDQAINRAHRIGQKNPVIVTKMICENTVEERIDKVLQEKREMFHAVLGDQNTNASAGLNAGDIFGLFDLRAKDGEGSRKIMPAAA